MVENNLWVERFRPTTLEGYIGNDRLVNTIQDFLDEGEIPHLLFYSLSPGTGKTTLAKIIANGLNCDVLSINASDDNNVETIRTRVKDFAQHGSFKDWKIVFLDEADYLSPSAQATLRGIMETYSATTRFILTCNYVNKLIEPLRSRCRENGFEIYPPTLKEVGVRIIDILNQEGITYDAKILKKILVDGYPDVRSILDTMQGCIRGGKLCKEPIGIASIDYVDAVISELKSGNSPLDKMNIIRQIFADYKTNDYSKLYTELFNRVGEYSTGKVGKLILTLASSQESYSLVADKELHVTALIIQLISQTTK